MRQADNFGGTGGIKKRLRDKGPPVKDSAAEGLGAVLIPHGVFMGHGPK